MRLFDLGLVITGWLYFGLLSISPALANPPCTVTASSPSMLLPSSFTSFGAMPKLLSSDSSSYFEVVCDSDRSGNLVLSIPSNNTYNGTPQFRVTTIDSLFTNTNNNYVSTVSIPFSAQGSTRSGKVYYQVQAIAPDERVLRAENDYAVEIKAELFLN